MGIIALRGGKQLCRNTYEPLSSQTGGHNKKGQGSKRTLTLSDASSSMGNGMTANRQSGMSVSMVLEHLRVSYAEGNDSVRKILLQIF
ncbi:hypothetical protein SBP18_17705 [Rhodoferax ferrireducens]|uniref:hypothetical protein n=1 Tax=Rhodoferax ferrireducens TaxID=192843 RepID=UPI00298D966E|nr:hypothetical protein [Rhodoferax ferrireducens]WPC66299.1 hypothetical protein SBP18_17705 [Rhodoferax ferrireducens]